MHKTRHLQHVDWRDLILAHPSITEPSVELISIDRVIEPGTNLPLLCTGANQRSYVVKTKSLGRPLGVELIVSRIGSILGCPVPIAEIVDVSAELLEVNRERIVFDRRCHIPGLAFGSTFIDNAISISPSKDPFPLISENVDRVATLAALFGLTLSLDEQYLRRKGNPRLLFAIDFHMFFNGPLPNVTDLYEDSDTEFPVEPSHGLRKWSMVEPKWFEQACQRLSLLTDEHIAAAVAEPPTEWHFDLDLRVAIADTMAARRNDLCNWVG